MRRISVIFVGFALAACESPSPTPPVQPVTIAPGDFCRVMKAVLPPSGKPSWSIDDTAETRTDARKIGVAVDARCRTAAR